MTPASVLMAYRAPVANRAREIWHKVSGTDKPPTTGKTARCATEAVGAEPAPSSDRSFFEQKRHSARPRPASDRRPPN